MRLNRKIQYGLLLVFYLSRSGRATLDVISQNLAVPKSFLEQIARQLRIGNVIKSVRGPSGGYELVSGSSIGDVFSSLRQVTLLSHHEVSAYRRGETEHRTLGRLVDDFSFSLSPVFNRSVKSVVSELVQSELIMLERAKGDTAARVN